MPLILSLVEARGKKAGRTGLVRFFWCLKLVLILVGRERFGSLMWILLDWFGNRAAGWQLACRLIQFLEICNILQILVPWWQRLWGSNGWYCAYFGWSKFLECDSIFRGSRIRIEIDLDPPPSINRQNLLCRSNFCYLLQKDLFLDSSSVIFTEPPWILLSSSLDGERKGGEDGGWAPASRESVHCDMSAIVLSPSWYISHRDRAPLLRAIAWWPTSIGADYLIPSRSFLGGGSF